MGFSSSLARTHMTPIMLAARPKARTTSGNSIHAISPVNTYTATPSTIAPIFSAAVDSKGRLTAGNRRRYHRPVGYNSSIAGIILGNAMFNLPTRSAPISAAL